MLRFRTTRTHDVCSGALSGALADSAPGDLARLDGEIDDAKSLVLDCEGIDHINSLGARAWCDWLKATLSRRTVSLVRVSVFFVDFANMVPAMVKGARVESVLAPMMCRVCSTEASCLLGRDDERGDALQTERCPNCAAPMAPQTKLSTYRAVFKRG